MQLAPTIEAVRPRTGTMRAFVIEAVGRTAIVEKSIPVPGPEKAFDLMSRKADGIIKPLIRFS